MSDLHKIRLDQKAQRRAQKREALKALKATKAKPVKKVLRASQRKAAAIEAAKLALAKKIESRRTEREAQAAVKSGAVPPNLLDVKAKVDARRAERAEMLANKQKTAQVELVPQDVETDDDLPNVFDLGAEDG